MHKKLEGGGGRRVEEEEGRESEREREEEGGTPSNFFKSSTKPAATRSVEDFIHSTTTLPHCPRPTHTSPCPRRHGGSETQKLKRHDLPKMATAAAKIQTAIIWWKFSSGGAAAP